MLRTRRSLAVTLIYNARIRFFNHLPTFPYFFPRSSPAASHSSSTTSTPPWTRPNSVATFGRRQTLVELTQPNCSSPLGPTQTDWCLYYPCISALCSEKDRLDVHLDLPGGGRLQRPHRGGCRPGRPPLHQCQRHCLRGLDSSHVGCMVGWPPLISYFYIFRYGHVKVVEVLLRTPKVEVDKLNQGSQL